MEKEIRARRIAAKVHAVERSIDDSMALAAELLVEMRAGAAEHDLAAQVSDGAFSKLVDAMTELQAARSSVVASHKRLEKIREALGIRVTGFISPNKIDTESEEAPAARRTA